MPHRRAPHVPKTKPDILASLEAEHPPGLNSIQNPPSTPPGLFLLYPGVFLISKCLHFITRELASFSNLAPGGGTESYGVVHEFVGTFYMNIYGQRLA